MLFACIAAMIFALRLHALPGRTICAAQSSYPVGCLSHWRLRDASGVNMQEKTEPVEIVSATGTLSQDRLHLHLSLSRKDLSTIGGHLAEGCIVNTTAEIVLLELEDVAFGAAYDADTGYDEITIQPL